MPNVPFGVFERISASAFRKCCLQVILTNSQAYRGDRKLEWGTLEIKNLVPQEELERAIETQENSTSYLLCTAWKALIHSYFFRYSWVSGHFFDF